MAGCGGESHFVRFTTAGARLEERHGSERRGQPRVVLLGGEHLLVVGSRCRESCETEFLIEP